MYYIAYIEMMMLKNNKGASCQISKGQVQRQREFLDKKIVIDVVKLTMC